MTDIKMADMIALPVKRTHGGAMPYLRDANDKIVFVGDRHHVLLTVTAINAYDANQKRIKELEDMLRALLNNKELDVFEMTTEIEELLNKEQE